MKKKTLVLAIAYYAMIPLICLGVLYLSSLILRASGGVGNLGMVMLVTYCFLFIGIPIAIAIFTRFSLLKWYLDPFAAAVAPLFLYCSMVFN